MNKNGNLLGGQRIAEAWMDKAREQMKDSLAYLGEKIKEGVKNMMEELREYVLMAFRMMTAVLPPGTPVDVYKTVMEPTLFAVGYSQAKSCATLSYLVVP